MLKINKNWLRIIISILIMGGFFLYRQSLSDKTHVINAKEVQKINPQEFDELASQEGVFILDVHTPRQTHIEGTDAFIPYNEIKDSADQLPADKDTPILVYCRSGSMSDWASEDLVEMGYTNVYDLVGGINAYREQNVSVYVTPETQELGTVIYGNVASTEFTLVNSTPVELTITRVSTSCECTSADLVKQVIDPYEEVKFTVSFDPAVHGDDSDVGDIIRTVYIETDNPNFDRVTTEITATVVKN